MRWGLKDATRRRWVNSYKNIQITFLSRICVGCARKVLNGLLRTSTFLQRPPALSLSVTWGVIARYKLGLIGMSGELQNYLFPVLARRTEAAKKNGAGNIADLNIVHWRVCSRVENSSSTTRRPATVSPRAMSRQQLLAHSICKARKRETRHSHATGWPAATGNSNSVPLNSSLRVNDWIM